MRLVPDPGEHKELRGVDGAPAHDDLRPARHLLLGRRPIAPVAVLDADRALPLEDDPRYEDVLLRRNVSPAKSGPANVNSGFGLLV